MEIDPAPLTELELTWMRSRADPANVVGMARFGISSVGTLGVKVVDLRARARVFRRLHRDDALRHAVAERLWTSGVHEARILASLVADPGRVTLSQAERWIRDVDSWDVCDSLCNNLLRKSPVAGALAERWPGRRALFTRRAGLVLLAVRAVHDREVSDAELVAGLEACMRFADDPRPLVQKGVSWALRQVGKRNESLRRAARELAAQLLLRDSRPARWIARDVERELSRKAAPLSARPRRPPRSRGAAG